MATLAAAVLAQGIYAGVISTISTVTMGTCSMVKSIYTHKNPKVSKILEELDLIRRMETIQTTINKIEDPKYKKIVKVKVNDQQELKSSQIVLDDLEKTQIFELIDLEPDLKTDPIEICLHYLHEIIQKIQTELITINKKVAYHNTKWFSSWRQLNIKPMVTRLTLYSDQLRDRFDDFLKINDFLQKIQPRN